MAGLLIGILKRHLALGGNAVTHLAGGLAAVHFDIEMAAADLLRIEHRNRNAVHRIDEQIAVAVVVGHGADALDPVRDRRLLGHLAGFDLFLQTQRHRARSMHDRSELLGPRAEHLVLHHAAGEKARAGQP